MNWEIAPLMFQRPKPVIRKKFTEEEDHRLRELVEEYGARQWDQIAEKMPGRSGRQCRDRYRNYLIPGFFNGQWSQAEDDLLRQVYAEMGPQWAKMMRYFKGRSANSLKNRWNYFVCRYHPENKVIDQKEHDENLNQLPASLPLPKPVEENDVDPNTSFQKV